VKAPPYAAAGMPVYQPLTLLPALRYTLPLLLLAASIWLAWRVVNFPPFADFLIATEAELNKVSWTTRPRLNPGHNRCISGDGSVGPLPLRDGSNVASRPQLEADWGSSAE